MESFHVILPSHPTPEFPNNTRASFRVRLPRRLDFPPEEKWQVALSDVTLGLTDVPWSLVGLTEKDDVMVVQGKIKLAKIPPLATNDIQWPLGRVTMKDVMSMHESMEGMTGLDFMQHLINISEQAFQGIRMEKGDRFLALPKYTWKELGGQTVLEMDTAISHGQPTNPNGYGMMMFSKELALKMKWVKFVKYGNATKLGFGPNLVPQLREYTMTVDGKEATVYGRSEDVNIQIPKGELFAEVEHPSDPFITTRMILFSTKVKWRFVNLNEAFEEIFNYRVRPVYIYTNVGESTTVGTVDTDLLRGVPYDSKKETTFYEPEREHFRDVRHRFLEIIEVNVAEAHGPLVKFSHLHSPTFLTLHFRRGQGIKTE